jgi:hypothetical protein
MGANSDAGRYDVFCFGACDEKRSLAFEHGERDRFVQFVPRTDQERLRQPGQPLTFRRRSAQSAKSLERPKFATVALHIAKLIERQ